MRISDWSSDVCSSDLLMRLWPFEQLPTFLFGDHSHIAASQRAQSLIVYYFLVLPSCLSSTCSITCFDAALSEASIKSISANTDRKSVVSGKSVSVRVDLGGRLIIKKKKKKRQN